jgi:hypothetical protein
MPTRQDLENMGPAELSTWCDKVADSPSASHVAADQARALKHEWALIQRASDPDLKVEKKKERDLKLWKDKAIALIAALPPSTFARRAKP